MKSQILHFFDTFFIEYTSWKLLLLSTFHFAILYFFLGYLFWKTCRFLFHQGIMEKINDRVFSKQQLRNEIQQSIYSIIVFGFSSLPLAYLIQQGAIHLRENTFFNTVSGLVILTFWNEVHFFVIHKALHLPILMKSVHHIHHRSVVPSVFSVYSFHPFEAFLLSSVLITIAPFFDFCSAALMLFPTVSILINFSGHSNYRIITKTKRRWLLFATKHNEHHGKARQEFGFLTNFMDNIFTKIKK